MAQNEPVKDAKKIVVDLTMTVEEARAVTWVGGNAGREPIGFLLDSGKLGKQDLAWAVDKSYNQKCRQASRTLLAYWLGQPATLEATKRFGPEVITGTNYLKEQEEDKLLEMGLFLGAGSVAVVALVIWILFAVIPTYLKAVTLSQQIAFAIVFAFVSLFPIGFGIWWWRDFKKNRNDYRSFRAGREGEDVIADRLRAILDNQWTIFRNLQLPERRDDVDLVLVGPGGVWAVQIKSSQTMLRAEGMNWEVSTKRGWVPAKIHPASEVSDHAKRLNIYLQKNGVNRWVERAVALATEQPISYFTKSDIPVWLLPTIENEVANLTTRTPPTKQETENIVLILKRLNDLQTTHIKPQK